MSTPDWRQQILVEQGGCPRCEAQEQETLMARDIISHLVRLCADYERRLAQAGPVTVITDR